MKSPLEQFENIEIYLTADDGKCDPFSVYTPSFWDYLFHANSLINLLLTTLWLNGILILIILNINYIAINKFYIFQTWIVNLVREVYVSNIITARKENKHELIILFLTILFCNLIGMISYSFTVSSALCFTFFIAFYDFIYRNTYVLKNQRWKSFFHLLPSRSIYWIAPFLVIIEMISYNSKTLSLSLRLFANMVAGHLMLKIVAVFFGELLNSNFFFVNLFLFITLLVLILLETFLAFLQSYVFVLLTTLYKKDLQHD